MGLSPGPQSSPGPCVWHRAQPDREVQGKPRPGASGRDSAAGADVTLPACLGPSRVRRAEEGWSAWETGGRRSPSRRSRAGLPVPPRASLELVPPPPATNTVRWQGVLRGHGCWLTEEHVPDCRPSRTAGVEARVGGSGSLAVSASSRPPESCPWLGPRSPSPPCASVPSLISILMLLLGWNGHRTFQACGTGICYLWTLGQSDHTGHVGSAGPRGCLVPSLLGRRRGCRRPCEQRLWHLASTQHLLFLVSSLSPVLRSPESFPRGIRRTGFQGHAFPGSLCGSRSAFPVPGVGSRPVSSVCLAVLSWGRWHAGWPSRACLCHWGCQSCDPGTPPGWCWSERAGRAGVGVGCRAAAPQTSAPPCPHPPPAEGHPRTSAVLQQV